jgi:DNA-binding GntR family transcriptional regulator
VKRGVRRDPLIVDNLECMVEPFELTRVAPSAALSRTVTDALREMIVRGGYQPDQHVKESDVAAALGVSRGPVREAFVQLEAEGFLELRRHRGAFVVSLTHHDIEEVHSLRLALERLAIQRAATRITPEQLAALDAVLLRMKRVKKSYTPEEAVDLDLAFHDIVFEAADHQRLRRSWEFVRSQVAFFLHTRNTQFRDFVEVGHSEHLELRDILAGGDQALAAAAIEDHVTGSYERLMHLHPELGGNLSGTSGS